MSSLITLRKGGYPQELPDALLREGAQEASEIENGSTRLRLKTHNSCPHPADYGSLCILSEDYYDP